MLRSVRGLAAALSALFLAQGAAAATLQVTGDGILIGARGVTVDGALYDVTFLDGSCVAAFGECDSEDDYSVSFAAAELFAQALLDQVFLGVFDTDPERTRGCSGFDGSQLCYVVVAGRPTLDVGRMYSTFAQNYSDAGTDRVNFGILPSGFDLDYA